MDFDIEKDFQIFDELLKKRPEIIPDKLKEDLKTYYLPYAQKLIELKKQKGNDEGVIVGVSAIQGIGKTTQGEILEVLLNHAGFVTVSRSIDDHYITHRELVELRKKDPRYIRRGVTHNIPLAIQDLTDLQRMQKGEIVLVSGYDKGAHKGDGDRFAFVNPEEGAVIKMRVVDEWLVVNQEEIQTKALQVVSVSRNNQNVPIPEKMGSDVPLLPPFLPENLCNFLQQVDNTVVSVDTQGDQAIFSGGSEISVPLSELPNGWRIEEKKADFIFYDGWMLGVMPVSDESIFSSGLEALETQESQEFAKMINQKLNDYKSLWDLFEFLTVLYIPDYHMSLKWRDQAEEHLRAKGEGMTPSQIREFVYYFWRSVHPAIHIKNLAMDSERTNQVVIINEDHTVKEVLTPDQVKEKYSS